MIQALIRAALKQRLIVVVVALVLLGFGFRGAAIVGGCFPDVTNVQVQIATEAIGRSPEEVERMATAPIEVAMTGLQGLEEMRSLNKPGLSLITLVFSEKTNVYFARQLVMERLAELGPSSPGIAPVLGPVSTGLGEVYQYTLDRPGEHGALSAEELTRRRIVQDWVVRPLLRSTPGVAEINSQGGYPRQYQIMVDPDRLRHYQVSVADVFQAVARNNAMRRRRAAAIRRAISDPRAGSGEERGRSARHRHPRERQPADLSARCGAGGHRRGHA
jgi:cobalt-zinc-cadmium resistance protein CzcA